MAVVLPLVFLSACSDQTTGANDDDIAPSVVAVSPSNDATEVERNRKVEITFSEAMNSETFTDSSFMVKQGVTGVNGTISYSNDTNTATFTPDITFEALTDYTAKVTKDVENAEGTVLGSDIVWSFTTGGSTATLQPVNLRTAQNYVVLARTAINNNPTSSFKGDLGLSPAAESYYTGFSQTSASGYSNSSQVNGRMYAADMADPTPMNLTTAVEDMITAYNDAAGRTTPDFAGLYTGNIGGKTLTPGLYKWDNTVLIPSGLTLAGGADDVWIFQIAEDLIVSSGVKITLIGGAQAKNIYWKVAGAATLGSNSNFEGIILSKTGITLNTGASLSGRILAQTAAIFDGNTVTEPTP